MKFVAAVMVIAGLLLAGWGGWTWVQSVQGQAQAREDWIVAPPEGSQAPPDSRDRVFARLRCPRLQAERFVMRGATEQTLKEGPAWVAFSDQPGPAGHTLIAGHRDTHFEFLKDIRVGDEVILDYQGKSFAYRVRTLQVVRPDSREIVAPAASPTLTLITCYPFAWIGPAPKRLLVRAELIGNATLPHSS